MNIFVLDKDVKKCAKYHCDKHVVKMLVEYTQLLSSTYYYTEQNELAPYKLTHKNHPCSVWTRKSLSNWLWLKELGLALYDEYKHRYNKQHKSGELLINLQTPNLDDIGLTEHPQCMPIEYMDMDVVKAYRNYYIGDKLHFVKYKNRPLPDWLVGISINQIQKLVS